jgi:hypothetical protein
MVYTPLVVTPACAAWAQDAKEPTPTGGGFDGVGAVGDTVVGDAVGDTVVGDAVGDTVVGDAVGGM